MSGHKYRYGRRVRIRGRHPYAGAEGVIDSQIRKEDRAGEPGYWVDVRMDDGMTVAATLQDLKPLSQPLSRQVDALLDAVLGDA